MTPITITGSQRKVANGKITKRFFVVETTRKGFVVDTIEIDAEMILVASPLGSIYDIVRIDDVMLRPRRYMPQQPIHIHKIVDWPYEVTGNETQE